MLTTRAMRAFMRRDILLLLAFLTLSFTAHASSITVSTSKSSYLRYELIDIAVCVDTDSYAVADRGAACVCVLHDSALIRTVGEMDRIPCSFDDVEGCWKGYWPIPWNPPLGTYVLEASVSTPDSSILLRAQSSVEIREKPRQPFDSGSCVMTIESTIDFLKTPFPTPFDAPGCRESFLTWARFLGADAIWYSVGQTMEGEPGVTDSTPWYPLNVSIFPTVAKLSKEGGFQFGGWIGCYFLWGEKRKELEYTYSWDYWKPTGRMYQPHRVSITDERRLSDIIDLVRRMDADPNVDFVGLDYIRTGFGGYEMVEEFARKMSVRVPADWGNLSEMEKREWLALEIEIEKTPDIVEKWQWWCAHRVAKNVNAIVTRSGLKKPLWVFLLGWEHGREHGQDPIMFHDAGASWCAVMLYESNADHCREMNESWSSYLDKGTTNLIIGESVDWELLQMSTDPPGPEEFCRRLTEAVDGLYGDGSVEGVFWHDLTRATWGKRGPYKRVEWAIAGAAAFSYARSKNNGLPLSALLHVPREVQGGEPFVATLVLRNRGSADVEDVVVEPIGSRGSAFLDDGPVWVGLLRGHTEASVGLRYTIVETDEENDLPCMVATRTRWAGERPQDQYVNFAYVWRQYRNMLTE